MALLLGCLPWVVTGAVGVWRWQQLRADRDGLDHVVLVVVVLCVLAVLATAAKVLRRGWPAASDGFVNRMGKSVSIGQRIEDLVLAGVPEGLALGVEREPVVEFALGFEECGYTRSELEAMADEDLVRAAYGIMADYARGQM